MIAIVLTYIYSLLARWPSLVAVCHRLAAVDRRILARAPKPEQAAYTSVGLLMLLAAVWTGLGMALKAFAAVEGPMAVFVAVPVGIFFFAVALAMETLVLSTLKSGSHAMVMARVVLSGILVTLQVMPLATVAYKDRIDFELHQRTLTDISASRATAAKARGVDELKGQDRAMQARSDVAQKALDMTGAAPQAVADAEAAYAKAGQALTAAGRATDEARGKLGKLRAGLTNPKLTDAAREKLETAIKSAVEKSAARQAELNRADAALANARTDVEATRHGWRTALEGEAVVAKQAVEKSMEAIKAAVDAQAQDVAAAEGLATKANKPGLLISVAMLWQIAMQDHAVLVSLLVALVVAGVVDLLPLLGKSQLLKGVHAKGAQTREEMELDRLGLASHQSSLDCASQRLLSQQEHDAIKKWTETDQGATQATELALSAQQRLAAAQLAQAAALTGNWADTMKITLEKLRTAQLAAEASPPLAPVFRAHLARLIASLENPVPGPAVGAESSV